MSWNLDPLNDSGWQRVLCCAAHPDDFEYGTSAAVHAWTSSGVEVNYLLLTSGEAGMADAPEVIGPQRRTEQRNACAAVGVDRVQFLNEPDGMLTEGLHLRGAIAAEIRKTRPDAVVTPTFDVEAFGGLNQADHRVAGLMVADAVRDAANPWVFPELHEEGLEAWSTSTLLVVGTDHPTHLKTVNTDNVQASVRSLEAHAEYLKHVGDHPVPAEFIPKILQREEHSEDSGYGVTFRTYPMG